MSAAIRVALRRGQRRRCAVAIAVFIALGWATPGDGAHAQDRPSEDQLFGSRPAPAPTEPSRAPARGDSGAARQTESATGPNPSTPPETGAPPAAAAPGQALESARDEAILGGQRSAMFTEEAAPEDPLKIGGRIYLRASSTGQQGQRLSEYAFSAPSLVDVYFDARPNDRVRGFMLGRMTYDPTLPSSAGALPAAPLSPMGSTSGSASPSSLFVGPTRGPHAVLDQLWLRFDVAHRVFVTAGKQHVRWGTGRFWSPADFLHLRRRNPLDVIDARTGTSMLKLHVPVESKAWNFYGYAITESVDTTLSLSRITAAARAEFVLGATELGLGALGHRADRPKFAADISTAIGDFDVYSELAVLDTSDFDRVRFTPDAELPLQPEMPTWQSPAEAQAAFLGQVVDAVYPVYRSGGYHPQAVLGLNYTGKYNDNDNDTFTLGAEYFYNALGYASASDYPGLVLPHSRPLDSPATFFYLGRHYAALFVSFPSPFKLDLHSFTLSTLGNLSDRSFITRLDYALVLLTHLRFEAFVAAHHGRKNGEFRFGMDGVSVGGVSIERAPAIADFGIALRLDI
jgi:hypothetical protein